MAAYLVAQEDELNFKVRDERFKDMLLVFDPERYHQVFSEDKGDYDEDDIEYVVPSSEFEGQKMLLDAKDAMREAGFPVE